MPRKLVVRLGLTVAGLAVLGIDLTFTAAWSGLAAVAAMLAVTSIAAIGAVRGRRPKDLVRLRGILRLETVVMLALAGFLLARGWVLYRQLFPAAGAEGRVYAAQTYDVVFVVLAAMQLGLLAAEEKLARGLLRMARRPALLLATSFAAMIVVGALLLTLPISVHRVADISFIDSLFTSTSAVCVTGLVVNDVGATYTMFGQVVLLLLIQLGGIGIMTITALAATFRPEGALAAQGQYAKMLDARSLGELRGLVRSVVVSTVAIEAIGALLLYAAWSGDPRLAGLSTAWAAIFHSVSAFCNAGFALWSTNLMPFNDAPFVQTVIMALIILGGIGFPVIMELWRQGTTRVRRLIASDTPRPPRLSLATRVVLTTSLLLVLGGALLVATFEATGTLADRSFVERIFNSFFSSVTTRTAGFNTLDLGAMRDATLLVVIVLMFIGGSPGSCAGGIKTTTAATIGAALIGELRGAEPQLARRAIAPEMIRRAVAVFATYVALVVLFTLLLTIVEAKPFLPLTFETVSALGTVGLSTGITPTLTVAGKLILSAAMFVGRTGPLTIALAVGRQTRRQPYNLARESLPIG
jgi:trk system potassium uptake protein TrkH